MAISTVQLPVVQVGRYVDDGRVTLGALSYGYVGGLFICKTLELPWKSNQNNISCIPPDTYICEYTRSPRFSAISLSRWLKNNPGKTETDCPEEIKNIYTYEIKDVPGRSGIRAHSANFAQRELKGCIALGSALKDLNMDGDMDIIHSGATVKKFEALMEKKPFMIKIANQFVEMPA